MNSLLLTRFVDGNFVVVHNLKITEYAVSPQKITRQIPLMNWQLCLIIGLAFLKSWFMKHSMIRICF